MKVLCRILKGNKFIMLTLLLITFFSCTSKKGNFSKVDLNQFQRLYERNALHNMNEITYPELDTFGQELKLHYEIFGGKGGRMTYSIALECEDEINSSKDYNKCFFRSYRKYATENEFCSLGANGRNRDKDYAKKYKQLLDLLDKHKFLSKPDLSDEHLFGISNFFVLQLKQKGKVQQIYLEPESEDAPIWKVLDLFSELTPEIKNCEISDSNFKYRSRFTN